MIKEARTFFRLEILATGFEPASVVCHYAMEDGLALIWRLPEGILGLCETLPFVPFHLGKDEYPEQKIRLLVIRQMNSKA